MRDVNYPIRRFRISDEVYAALEQAKSEERIGKPDITWNLLFRELLEQRGRAGPATTDITAERRDPDVDEIYQEGLKLGFSPGKPIPNQMAIKRMLESRTKHQILRALYFSQQFRDEEFMPQINNFMDLEDKYLSLRSRANKKLRGSSRVGVIE